MSDDVMGQWTGPGVRLTDTVMADGGLNDSLPSALPVFIGWCAFPEAKNGVVEDAGVHWVKMATWDQQPWPFPDENETCLQDTVRHYFDNGGGPCFILMGTAPPPILAVTDLITWWETFSGKASSLLLREPSITLVAVPQLVALTERVQPVGAVAPIAETFNTVWQILLRTCISRPDLFFVLDAPRDPAVATSCIEALRQTNVLGDMASRAALYGPHLVTDYRMASGKGAVVPPCGAVLGVYGLSDVTDGVWKAPANEALQHVVQPEYRETLTHGWFAAEKASINLIRSFSGRGTRVWGCRTLSDDPSFRYVQVRRAVTWIEVNLKQICRFAMFEPNNEITWFQVRGLCCAWLRRVWLDGGLAGADEASAYSVRVGLNESMTMADIEAGRLIIQVGVSVLHAAEFIDVKLELIVGDAQGSGVSLQRSE